MRNLEGIDFVVLGLAAVDRIHIERVAQDEGNALAGTQVSEPVPGEHALDGHDETFAKRLDSH